MRTGAIVSTEDRPANVPRSSNLFDVFRLVAASMVVVGHSWALLGIAGVPTVAGVAIHHLGVYVFFAISGFLLSQSWSRAPRAALFLIRRSMRIFPALILVVVLTTFAIAPLLTRVSMAEYWGSSETWRYLLNVTLVAQYNLPGMFVGNPSTAINGSLWSLGPEFCCYIMVVALGLISPPFSLASRAILAVILIVAILAGPIEGPLRTTAIAVIFFLVGSVLAQIPGVATLPVWPGLLAVLVLVPLHGSLGLVAACLVVPYAVVTLGSRASPIASAVRRLGDPSYGMYLWAFPIQQALIALFDSLPLIANIAVVLVFAGAAGYGSWHLLEKRAIAFGAQLSARAASSGAKP